jgi:hypothetical protein
VNFGTKQVGTFTVKDSTITNTGSTELLVQTVADRMPDQFSGAVLWADLPHLRAGAPGPGRELRHRGRLPARGILGRSRGFRSARTERVRPDDGVPIDSVLVEFRGVTRL